METPNESAASSESPFPVSAQPVTAAPDRASVAPVTATRTPVPTSESAATPPISVDLKNPVLAAALAWLVPGLGHVYQGRVAKGMLYFVCLVGLFAWGLRLGEGKVAYWAWDVERRQIIAGGCRMGIGVFSIPAVLQWRREPVGGIPWLNGFLAPPTVAELRELNARLNPAWEIATLFTMIAGLLNVLVIWDAYRGPAMVELPPESVGEGETE